MHFIKSIDGAIKLAVHHHLPSLAEKMNLIKEKKMKSLEDQEYLPDVSFDVKQFIKKEMDKLSLDILQSQKVASIAMEDDKASEILITPTAQDSSSSFSSYAPSHQIATQKEVLPSQKVHVAPKPKLLNPFAISNKKGGVQANGKTLLNAMASSIKMEQQGKIKFFQIKIHLE